MPASFAATGSATRVVTPHAKAETILDRRPVEPASRPLAVYRDDTTVSLQFNVMPNRPVAETLFVREYRIWHRYIEATFDRNYSSAMARSPSHLVFTTALTHTQKMLYAYACHEFGVPYDPHGPELFKFWPTKVDVRIPKMIREETDLVHRLHITELKEFNEAKFKFVIESRVNDLLTINAQVPFFRV